MGRVERPVKPEPLLVPAWLAADLLNISERLVWKLAKDESSDFPRPRKVGARTLWSRAAIEKYATAL